MGGERREITAGQGSPFTGPRPDVPGLAAREVIPGGLM